MISGQKLVHGLMFFIKSRIQKFHFNLQSKDRPMAKLVD